MAFIPVPNTVEATLRFLFTGQTVTFSLKFEFPTRPTRADMTNLAGSLGNWLQDSLMPLLTTGISATGTVLRDLTEENTTVVEDVYSTPIAGEDVTGSTANNVALVVKHLTDKSGRSYRGRTYLPGVPRDSVADAVSVTSGFLGGVLDAFGEMFDAVDLLGWTPVVVSRQQDGAPLTTGITTPVTGYGGDIYIDSQRRRLFGRGE